MTKLEEMQSLSAHEMAQRIYNNGMITVPCANCINLNKKKRCKFHKQKCIEGIEAFLNSEVRE